MTKSIILRKNGISREIQSKVLLSPLSGITDKIYRKIVRKWAPNSLLFTEMINATRLKLGHGIEKIKIIEMEEGPIGVQIFNNRPYAVAEAAKKAEASGAFLIDINMGCPVKKISRKGGGSALIKDPKLAMQLVRIISKSVKIPVTVKTRIGWSNNDKNIESFAQNLQDAGANMLTVHGRTKEQGFSGKADWGIIEKIKGKLEIPVIANGDICNGEDALKCISQTNADGIMIGRAVLGAPWIIGQIDATIEGNKDFRKPNLEEKLKLTIEHIDELIMEKGEHGLLEARKYISWTFKQSNCVNNLKNKLLRTRDPQDAKRMILEAITYIKDID